MSIKRNNLAQFLKEKRILSGCSQSVVSQKLGYKTPQFISNWERGISVPPINVIRKVAQMYHSSAEELFELILEVAIEGIEEDLALKFKRA